MLRFLPLIVALFFALPAVAEQVQQLSPEQVESLPFSTNGAGTPNTEALMGEDIIEADIDGAHSEHGEEKAGLPQFDTSTFASQLFWLFITFVLLYAFFAKSGLPKLSAIIEDRMTTIKNDLEQADSLSAAAENTRTAYEEAMGSAHDKARFYVSDTVAALRKQAEQESAVFKEKSDAEIRKLQATADAAKEKIKGELAETAASLTSEIISKLADIEISESDVRKVVANHMDVTNTKKAA